MNYPGGKNGAGVYQQLINLMPPHRAYLEPFLGSGAVMRMKRPAVVQVGVDQDARTLEAFRRSLPDYSPELAVMDGSGTPSLQLASGDGVEFLRSYEWRGGELVYADPPYLIETRSTKRRLYRHEMLTAKEHEELLRVLVALPCMVMISGYYSELYEGMLTGWRRAEFQTTNRAGKRTVECVWMNYPEPLELHDYRYLGENFRERERIKRKRKRWRSKLERLPPLERHAVFSAIEELRNVSHGRG